MASGSIKRVGSLAKIGVGIINGTIMLESSKRIHDKNFMDAKEQVEKDKLEAMLEIELTVHHWIVWTGKGKLDDKKLVS